jgi:competence protein CoiA
MAKKHVADVKTEHGVVLEFQHSYLKPAERGAREAFYKKMVWVVDGRSRPRDRARLDAVLRLAVVVSRQPLLVSVPSSDGGLLRDWEASRVPVYLDFGGSDLWRMNPHSPNGRAHLLPVTKASFLKAHLEGLPFEEPWTQDIEHAVANYYFDLLRRASHSRPSTGFEQYMAKRQRARRRF